MNKFYDKTLSESIAEHEKFMKLIQQIDEDPGILDLLSLEELLQVNAYYKQKNKKLEAKAAQSEKIEKLLSNVEIKPGDLILHKKFGKGKIKTVTDTRLIVDYPSVGQKTLDRAWCEKNCKIIKGEHV